MTRKYRRYDKHGNEIEDEDDFLKDGERISFPMNFMDSARNAEIKAACDQRNAAMRDDRHIDDEAEREAQREAERAAYARRVSNAWRGDDDCLDGDLDHSPDAQRERYIKRITNAWRAGP